MLKNLAILTLLLTLVWGVPVHAEPEKNEAAEHNREGAKFLQEGNMEQAVESFQKAVELNANDPIAHLNLAFVYDRQGRTEEAIAAYQRAIELSPSNLLAYNNLGVLYDRMGRYDEAIAEFKNALAIDPTDANTLKNLETAKTNKGVIEQRAGEIFELQKQVEAFPDNPIVLYNLGRAYAFYEDKENAIKWITQALEKGYDDFAYMKLDPALEKIRSDARFKELLAE